MGILTKIEDFLGNAIEGSVRNRGELDPVQIEIAVKRELERNRKDLLGAMILPNKVSVSIEESLFRRHGCLCDAIGAMLEKALGGWMREKNYRMLNELSVEFRGEAMKPGMIDVAVSHEEDRSIARLIDGRPGGEYKIHQAGAIIGRALNCGIRVDDPVVSGRHASLQCRHGKIILQDLGSRSGTRVNRIRVTRAVLYDGDVIHVGRVLFTFTLKKSPGGSP